SPWGIVTTYINERFATGIRASGYGIGYSLAVVIPGFLTFYLLWLGKLMPYIYTPLVFLVLGGLFQLVGAALGPEPRDVDLGSRSARLFPELVERIERVSGMEVEYRQGESLALAFEATERLRVGRWLEPAECLELEPGLNPDLVGAALLAESQVTPPRFVQALARTATAQGAKVRTGAPVASFEVHGGRLGGI